MLVCSHGNVEDFCKDKDMVIVDRYDGDLERYAGLCRVIVSDADLSEGEYYFLKGKMLAKGVELISTIHKDAHDLSFMLANSIYENHKPKSAGRYKFGFQRIGGMVKLTEEGRAVINRILELRDLGYTYRAIREDSGVHHPNGKKLHISTIQNIIKNREEYEKER